MYVSVDLTSIGFDKNTNLFLNQNLSDYNNKIAFHCRELRRKRLLDWTWKYGGKVFIKIQDPVKCLVCLYLLSARVAKSFKLSNVIAEGSIFDV